MRTNSIAALAIALGLACLTTAPLPAEAQVQRLNAGTRMDVRLDTEIATDEVRIGDEWSGRTVSHVYSNRGALVIPAGSYVSGTITHAVQGDHHTRPSLGLAVRQVEVDGYVHNLDATTPTIVAGSKRTKKLGTIAAGTAGGAVLGGLIEGRKGAVIGGLLGGAATYGLTRKGHRTMKLKEGTLLTFTVDHNVAIR